MIIVSLSSVCKDFQLPLLIFLQNALKKEDREAKSGDGYNVTSEIVLITEDREDTGHIILRKEDDRQKIKLLIEEALGKIVENANDAYLVTENDEDSSEIVILKKGDIGQLGLFICEFCPMVFRSEIEKNIHQRVHYFGFG